MYRHSLPGSDGFSSHQDWREKQCEEAREQFVMRLQPELVGKQQRLIRSPVPRGTSNRKGEEYRQDIFTAE